MVATEPQASVHGNTVARQRWTRRETVVLDMDEEAGDRPANKKRRLENEDE